MAQLTGNISWMFRGKKYKMLHHIWREQPMKRGHTSDICKFSSTLAWVMVTDTKECVGKYGNCSKLGTVSPWFTSSIKPSPRISSHAKAQFLEYAPSPWISPHEAKSNSMKMLKWNSIWINPQLWESKTTLYRWVWVWNSHTFTVKKLTTYKK